MALNAGREAFIELHIGASPGELNLYAMAVMDRF